MDRLSLLIGWKRENLRAVRQAPRGAWRVRRLTPATRRLLLEELQEGLRGGIRLRQGKRTRLRQYLET